MQLINIHRQLQTIYRIAEHQFIMEMDAESAQVIDEVYFWAHHVQRRHKLDFDLLTLLEKCQIRFKSMRQLAEVLDRTLLKECGISDVELIDSLISDMERI